MEISQLISNHVLSEYRSYDAPDPFELVTLRPNSCEYREAKDLFFMKKNIRLIERVSNPFLYLKYQLKFEEYESRGDVKKKTLFHDTSDDNADKIIKNNFDWRCTTRGKYGRGVSFSDDPCYANRWSNWDNGSRRTMIISEVLVGTTEYGSYDILPVNADTTFGNNTVFVKFYDDEFYPKYLIRYND